MKKYGCYEGTDHWPDSYTNETILLTGLKEGAGQKHHWPRCKANDQLFKDDFTKHVEEKIQTSA